MFGELYYMIKRIIAAFTVLAVLLFSAGCGGGKNGGKKEEINMADFPLYVEDTSAIEYSEEAFNKKRSQPYWYGNVMYNEIALPISYADGSAYAKLLYTPERIISVMDQKLKTTYVEGADYTVDKVNKRLIIPESSSIELLGDKAEAGINVPIGYEYEIWNFDLGPFVSTESGLFYDRYLSVTYAFDIAEIPTKNVFNKYDENSLAAFREKAENGQDVSVAVIGDSISAGASSTSVLKVEPYGPSYATQLKSEIERVYGVNVNLVNVAVGGTLSDWITSPAGAANLLRAKDAKPDLCVIAYGMNDSTGGVMAESFGENIQSAVNEIVASSPDCEFILVNSFPCNPRYNINPWTIENYPGALNEVAEKYPSGKVKVVDMQKVGNYMIKSKRYCEISSSNVNHPNDFFHRVYAMNIMSAIYDYGICA